MVWVLLVNRPQWAWIGIARASGRVGVAVGALLLDHLEVALQPVLDVGRREVARVDEVGLDEGGRLAGALLHLAQDQQLAGREAVAALDRVDQHPSAWYSSMYLQIMSTRDGRFRLV
jgi:hypothetical protein